MDSILSISGLKVHLGKKNLYNDFSLSFEKNKVTAILGPSGSGKTTLLNVIAGLLQPERGTILFADNTRRVSYLFQEPRLLPWKNLLKNVMMPLENLYPKTEAEQRARSFLAHVGLENRLADFPGKLSGGERQRASLARSFAFSSSVLLMDEAFQSQDLRLKMQLMDLLRNLLSTEKRTVLAVTHDIREALYIADRIIVLAGQPMQIRLDADCSGFRSQTYMELSQPALDIEKSIFHILAE